MSNSMVEVKVELPADDYEALVKVSKKRDESIGQVLHRAISKEAYTDNNDVKIIVKEEGEWKEVVF